MKTARQFKANNIHMGNFRFGEDIHTELERFCAEKDIKAAWVNVIGALSRAEIAFYDQHEHKYHTRVLDGDYEIVSCSGNFSLKDGKPFGHLHIVLSDTEYKALGGHLMPGSVKIFAGEFVLFELDKADVNDEDLERCPDVETGLALW